MNIRTVVADRCKELDWTSYRLWRAVEQHGIKQQSIHDFIAGRSNINSESLGHILTALRLKIVAWDEGKG